ncbi:MAG: adenylate kinase family protein [Candidatus Aenigmarchaeota archaeon]|nr:adenylate kinase family protein [Candidatus Aenigmarchaeota archaeon]MDI6722736.1 adenylate kinase family protein [Candidatus Aenigmarchaeota archaeon]
MKNLIICISGTPGTGKTAVAKELKKLIDGNLISINSLIRKGAIKCGWDKKRKTRIVDVKDAERAARKRLKDGINIVDSHYSHLMRCGLCVILRTNPLILIKRLEKRGWSRAKIKENVMAEMLDEISIEAKEKDIRFVEIDTSKTTPEKAARKIKSMLNSFPMQKYYRARTDWTRRYSRLLTDMGKGG